MEQTNIIINNRYSTKFLFCSGFLFGTGFCLGFCFVFTLGGFVVTGLKALGVW